MSGRLPLTTHRRTSISAVPQAVYLGLEIEFGDKDKVEYAICTHDGCYAIDFEISTVDISNIPKIEDRVEKVIQVVLENISLYSRAQNYKIHAIGLGAHLKNGQDMKSLLFTSPSLASRLWLELDALPFVIKTKGKTVDERASSAVRKTVVWYINIIC